MCSNSADYLECGWSLATAVRDSYGGKERERVSLQK